MENPANNNSFAALAIEDDVPTLFDAAACGLNRATHASDSWRLANPLDAFLNLSDITERLVRAAVSNCVSRYGFQVRKRKA
jgi:hypothetical protein